MHLNKTNNRRGFLKTSAATVILTALPFRASALSEQQSVDLINKVIAEVQQIINSGKPEANMLADFEGIFKKYADVATIARYCLGAPWRNASSAQQRAYIPAFQRYISRKYGKQFRSFKGAEIMIIRSRDAGKLGILVESTIDTPSKAPFSVEWNVSDRSGRPKFINLIIEGISMLATERAEIGAMLESFGGNMDKLVAHLKSW
ncbi:MAG: ABC transporter substrate-binding protein [Paracoccaceae bacterium]